MARADPGGAERTIAEALEERDRRLFVGRDRELEWLDGWLARPATEAKICSLVGPGGIGKSTLVRAFARATRSAGRPVAVVDGRVTEPSPDGVARALGTPTPSEAVAALNADRPLLVLDSFEDLRPLTHFLLEDFLPLLTSDVPVVIASREDVTALWRSWRELIAVLPVGGLGEPGARELLARRGLAGGAEVERILAMAKGHPLALAMAADVAARAASPLRLPEVPEWRMVVRSLVEDLLRYDDPELRPVLEAAAVVRQFDEATLAEMLPGADRSAAFARLCGLSVVRAGQRGLMLHDEVRGILRDDLRWRNPARYQELRRSALDVYRRRLADADADPDERGWIFTEVAYLSEDPFVHLGMFQNDDPSELWAERARPADRAVVLQLQAALVDRLAGERQRPTPEELDPALLSRLLEVPDTRLQLAWSRTDGAVGYGLALPIVPAIVALLPTDGAIARLTAAALSLPPGTDLRRAAVPERVWFLGTIVPAPGHPETANGVLTREVTRLFAEPALLLTASADPRYLSFLAPLGFRTVPFEPVPGAFDGLTGMALDLRLLGSEGFVQLLAGGTPPPLLPPVDALEEELGAALEGWDDERRLAGSPLVELARFVGKAPDDPAEAVRRLVTDAVATARQRSLVDDDALRAVELAYLDGTIKLEAAARRVAVSRTTFYRMRKRAVRGLAEALVILARSPA